MRYLVATDGSEESDDAVEYAAEQALAFDAALEIVHVLTPETQLVDGELVLPGEGQAIQMGERTLEGARSIAEDVVEDRGETLPIETDLLAGRPADAIVERAEEADADAIFVGHRGLSEEQRQVVGSVAKRIVDEADVPVTVIR